MRGINVAGGEFGGAFPGTYGVDYQYGSAESFGYLAQRGHQLVRLPFRWERVQPTRSSPLDPTGLQRLTDAVDRAWSVGLKVVLDLHNYGRFVEPDGTTRVLGADLTQAELVDLWARLSTAFNGHPGIHAYGLMNEPHDLPNQPGPFTATSTVWSFESGTENWGGEGSATVARSSTVAAAGTYSLAVSNTPAGTGGVVFRANDSASNTLIEADGSTLRGQVWLPADAPGGNHLARLDMQNSSWQWQPGPEVALTPGAWTTVSYTPPSSVWTGHKGIALQVRYDATTQDPLTVYLDEVQQGAAGAGQSALQSWESACQAVVAAIRGNGDNTLIFVPGYDWSSASRWAHTAPWVADGNVAYEAHYYFDRDNSGAYPDSFADETTDATSRGYASLADRATTEMATFLGWLAANDVPGFIGEYGWPNGGDTAGWNSAGDALLSQLDEAGVSATVWAAGEWFGAAYNLSVYTGTPLATPTSIASVVEAHRESTNSDGGIAGLARVRVTSPSSTVRVTNPPVGR